MTTPAERTVRVAFENRVLLADKSLTSNDRVVYVAQENRTVIVNRK
jgi:hypothetical protein